MKKQLLISSSLGDQFLYMVLIIPITIIIAYFLFPLIKKYSFKVGLEEDFPDFLALLSTFELNGLKLDNLFDEASKGNIVLSKPYQELARIYKSLSNIDPDPYVSIRRLADYVPSDKIKRFLRGYSEILISTNDTLTYISSYLEEEFAAIKTRVSNTLNLIDSLFEGFLIILLGLIVYSLMPLAYFSSSILMLIIVLMGLISYIITLRITSLTVRGNTTLSRFATDFLIIGIYPLLVAFIQCNIFIHALVFAVSALILRILDVSDKIENEAIGFIEELYSDARQGIPIDVAIINSSHRRSGFLVKIADFLKMGLKSWEILSVLKLPPLVRKIFLLTLTPIEYSRNHQRHLGYVLTMLDNIRGLRRSLSERSNFYFLYILTIPMVVIVFFKTFIGINVGLIKSSMDYVLIRNTTYIAVYESAVIASIINKGSWYKSLPAILIVVAVAMVLSIMI